MTTRRDFLRTMVAAPIGIATAHALSSSAAASDSSRRRVLFENFANLRRWQEMNYPRLYSRNAPSLATNIGGRTSSCLKLTGTDPVFINPAHKSSSKTLSSQTAQLSSMHISPNPHCWMCSSAAISKTQLAIWAGLKHAARPTATHLLISIPGLVWGATHRSRRSISGFACGSLQWAAR